MTTELIGQQVTPDPDDDSRRVLAVSKSNLAAPPPALAYRLLDAPEHGCARIAWEGTTEHRATDLLTTRLEDEGEGTDAASVLTSILSEGPMWAKAAIDAMAEAGFSKDQTKRAKAKLRVTTVKVGKPGDPEQGWQWSLPVSRRAHEGSEGSGEQNPAPFAPLALPSESSDPPPGLTSNQLQAWERGQQRAVADMAIA